VRRNGHSIVVVIYVFAPSIIDLVVPTYNTGILHLGAPWCGMVTRESTTR
jgi:hypothetical protein